MLLTKSPYASKPPRLRFSHERIPRSKIHNHVAAFSSDSVYPFLIRALHVVLRTQIHHGNFVVVLNLTHGPPRSQLFAVAHQDSQPAHRLSYCETQASLDGL